MFRDEPHQTAFKAAAQATRARIRRDRARAPRALRKLFTVIASRLFHPSLNANEAWKEAGIRTHRLGGVFKEVAGTSLGQYIAAARIEVASALMATTDLQLTTVSLSVGYTHHPTFADNFKRLKGKLPSRVARKALPPPLIDDEMSLKAGRGLLDDDTAVDHIEQLLRIYPVAANRVREAICAADAATEPRVMVDGAHSDELKAEGLWQQISDLPFDAQCQQVRRYLFYSTVLFDLLRKKSRLEGRKSRQRGVEVAELALVSLETSDQVFGERIHDLRALGWAWAANALILALDFAAAAAAFEQADREWSRPREKQDLSVLATIYRLKGVMRMMRREYVEAIQDLDHSCSLCQQLVQKRGEAKAMIQRASVHTYAGKLSEAVENFREAASLIDEDQERELAFAIRGNLAAALARGGEAASAVKELERARQLNRHIDDPLGTIKLDWIEGDLGELQGDLEKAKRFYTGVRTEFRDAGESRYLGMVSVDLMTIHSQLGEWESVGELAVVTLPLLAAMQLHSETVAVVNFLAEAIKTQGFSRRLLKDLRAALRQDPLAM